MNKSTCLLLTLLTLSACVTDREMPNNDGAGSDLMRKSPCVCLQLDYDARAFQWRS